MGILSLSIPFSGDLNFLNCEISNCIGIGYLCWWGFMLISYDKEADALYIRFASGRPRDSVEIDDGIIVDVGENGEI